jgi:hypothetical protein
MAMKTAAILGLDTAAGAYLARLLGARGYAVRGSGEPALLAQLGIADDVVRDDDVAAAIEADEIYDLRGDAAATADLLALGGTGRVFIAVAPGSEVPTTTDRFVAAAWAYPNESRLGPGTSSVARIVAAAAAGVAADPADLATSIDCGWTAEYVDAMWRLLQRPKPETLAIATGRLLLGSTVARIAYAYFKRPAPMHVAPVPGIAGDPAPAAAALGWRAVTWGDDLVTVLCEGAAA